MKRSVMMLIAAFFLFLSCRQEKKATPVSFISHDIMMVLDVSTHSAVIDDRGELNITASGLSCLSIHHGADIASFTLDGLEAEYRLLQPSDSSSEAMVLRAALPQDILDIRQDLLVFTGGKTGPHRFSLSYKSTFFEDVGETHFSNQNIGREIDATILDKGAYFSPSSAYYPLGGEKMASFAVTVDMPSGWESIADGNQTDQQQEAGRTRQRWMNPYRNDGLMVMAAPYVLRHGKSGDTDVYCAFFADDTSLFETYLPATIAYIGMYSELIGPYPFDRFTVAENFFPTGYGMPAWTLLGQQVLRLPFIVMTSLGHEVLHNWWGNSVYVDTERGNWCEGLTVYGADYLYKKKKSPEEAKSYRKDILKDYMNYVRSDSDFPIRKFTARHDAASRTIGYNKTMMVYQMINDRIGDEAFYGAWKDIYRDYRGKQISFEEWIDAWQKRSGKDLNEFIPQWIDRAGAPLLSLAIDSVKRGDDAIDVKFTVSQEADSQLYTLRVPLRFSGPDGHADVIVGLNKAAQVSFTYHFDTPYTTLELDPDYRLFRRLHPDEIEAVLSGVLGCNKLIFITDDDQNNMDLYRTFAENLSDRNSGFDPLSYTSTPDNALIYLNPPMLPDYVAPLLSMSADSIRILGRSYPLSGHTFVLAGYEPGSQNKNLSILSYDPASLPRIGSLLQHYGKYSYLVFNGSQNVGKGQWPAIGESLIKDLTQF